MYWYDLHLQKQHIFLGNFVNNLQMEKSVSKTATAHFRVTVLKLACMQPGEKSEHGLMRRPKKTPCMQILISKPP